MRIARLARCCDPIASTRSGAPTRTRLTSYAARPPLQKPSNACSGSRASESKSSPRREDNARRAQAPGPRPAWRAPACADRYDNRCRRRTRAGELRLRELARQHGVSLRAVHRHFEDCKALVIEVAVEGWRRLGARLERARSRSTAPVQDMVCAIVSLLFGALPTASAIWFHVVTCASTLRARPRRGSSAFASRSSIKAECAESDVSANEELERRNRCASDTSGGRRSATIRSREFSTILK